MVRAASHALIEVGRAVPPRCSTHAATSTNGPAVSDRFAHARIDGFELAEKLSAYPFRPPSSSSAHGDVPRASGDGRSGRFLEKPVQGEDSSTPWSGRWRAAGRDLAAPGLAT